MGTPVIDGGLTIAEIYRKYEEKRWLDNKIAAKYEYYENVFNIVMDILNKSFQENCIGSDTQSVDGSMVKFKGRSSMKQYMPKKPIKRGYKVWARCDSETGYLYQFNIYTGRIENLMMVMADLVTRL